MAEQTIFNRLYKTLKQVTNPVRDSKADVVTKTGRKYSYNYATLDQVLGIVKTALHENGLVMIQNVTQGDGGLELRLSVYDESGSSIVLDSRPYKQLPMPQEQGSWETYMRRYQIMMAFGLAGEDDDGAAASVGVSAQIGSPRDMSELTTIKKELAKVAGVSENAMGATIMERFGNPKDMSDAAYNSMLAALRAELDKERTKNVNE